MGAEATPRVTIAVVSWNTRDLLDRCLTAFADDARAGADVCVVDNASTDGSAAAAKRHPYVRVIAAEENLGFGPAVDLVARSSAAPWIACANADTAVTPGALNRLLAVGAAKPAVGAVAPRLRLPDGATQHSVHAFPTLPTMAFFNSGLARLRPDLGEQLAFGGYWDPERAREVDWALGAFLLIRRSAFDRAGGFGPQRRLYGEDLDLGWRLARAGYKTWYEPRAVVHHAESSATTLAWGDKRHDRRMEATYEWLLRRRGPARTIATAVLNLGGAGLRGLAPPTPRKLQGAAHEMRLHAGGFRRAVARRRTER